LIPGIKFSLSGTKIIGNRIKFKFLFDPLQIKPVAGVRIEDVRGGERVAGRG
jgi:hypothetical protein